MKYNANRHSRGTVRYIMHLFPHHPSCLPYARIILLPDYIDSASSALQSISADLWWMIRMGWRESAACSRCRVDIQSTKWFVPSHQIDEYRHFKYSHHVFTSHIFPTSMQGSNSQHDVGPERWPERWPENEITTFKCPTQQLINQQVIKKRAWNLGNLQTNTTGRQTIWPCSDDGALGCRPTRSSSYFNISSLRNMFPLDSR